MQWSEDDEETEDYEETRNGAQWRRFVAKFSHWNGMNYDQY